MQSVRHRDQQGGAGAAEQYGEGGAVMRDVPEPFASPKIPPSSTSTRICEWCAESIPEKALKCPHCTKWRKDIAEDRKKFSTNTAASIVLCVLSIIFFIGVWGDSSDQSIMRERPFAELGEWHERVVTGGKFSDLGAPTGANMRKLMESREAFGHPEVHYEFSVRKFLSSFWGWTVIALRNCRSVDRRLSSSCQK